MDDEEEEGKGKRRGKGKGKGKAKKKPGLAKQVDYLLSVFTLNLVVCTLLCCTTAACWCDEPVPRHRYYRRESAREHIQVPRILRHER